MLAAEAKKKAPDPAVKLGLAGAKANATDPPG
jgi:hypothetical protein